MVFAPFCDISVFMFNSADYYRENREKLLAWAKAYYLANREKCIERSKKRWRRNKEWRTAHPWMVHWRNAVARCEIPTARKYEYYGGAGIKCLLTKEQTEQLWHRDEASSLKQPSLSRKDSSGCYTFDNCRFIEFAETRVNRQYGRPNTTCRICSTIFCGNGMLKVCPVCRKLELAKNAKYSPLIERARRAALERGLTVEPVFNQDGGIVTSSLKINGELVIVSRCDNITINRDGGRYSHLRASRKKAEIYCLVRRVGKRREIFFYSDPLGVTDFFIPVVLTQEKHGGRKPLVNWPKLKDAWHLFDAAPR